MTLRREIAGFSQTRAEPVKADGRAGFGYSRAGGVITLYIEHRLAAGFPATGDITPEARKTFLQEMHETYGKTDSEKPFRLSFHGGGKQGVVWAPSVTSFPFRSRATLPPILRWALC